MKKTNFKKGTSIFVAFLMVLQLLSLMPLSASASGNVMEVTIGGITTGYADFGEGWMAAAKASETTHTMVKLLADWVAPDGYFCYKDANGNEVGTMVGMLSLESGDNQMTIDLNGHTLDRGLKGKGVVANGKSIFFHGETLTITDSSEAQTGTITGGSSSDYGGAVYFHGNKLIIENITIKDNATQGYGGAVYVSTGNVVIRNSNIINNSAGYGGAFGMYQSCNLTIENSHIDYNTAKHDGGAFEFHDSSSLVIKDSTINNNKAEEGEGGAIVVHYDGSITRTYTIEMYGGEICNNTAATDGGAIFIEKPDSEITGASNHFLRIYGGTISGNEARGGNGGGIYWKGTEALVMTGGEIINNTAKYDGGGIYVLDMGDVYFGGDAVVKDNTDGDGNADNVYLTEGVVINHAMEQEHAPLKPLSAKAYIGITAEEDGVLISDDTSLFREDSQLNFHADNPDYYIRAVYDEDEDENAYQMYYKKKSADGIKYPYVLGITVMNNELITNASLDNETNTITLTAVNTKKKYFEGMAPIRELIALAFNDGGFYIENPDNMLDYINTIPICKVENTDGVYGFYNLKVVPEGGQWAEVQDELVTPYKMIVDGKLRLGFKNQSEGWAKAVEMGEVSPTTVILLDDWLASNGSFYCKNSAGNEFGSNNGYLYLESANCDITLDLNGHTLSRNLSEATSEGFVIYLLHSKLTITDSSEAQTGKITGGKNTGLGGAIYFYGNGTLNIEGGNITGNSASGNGGAVYCYDEDLTVNMSGGKISGNSSSGNGGAFFMERGSLYMTGGEISTNTAANGGGIYWESRFIMCLTGGKITGNVASGNGGGVYGTDWGDMYLGGTINITGNKNKQNTNDNFYISDTDVYINHAKGQAEGVPNIPLRDGAKISISSANAVYNSTILISGSDSRFDMESLLYFTSDNSGYFVRGVYDEDGENHTNQFYYTPWGYTGYPVIDDISIKNSDLVSDISFERAEQIITITAKNNKKSSFDNMTLDYLINYTFAEYAVAVEDISSMRNMRFTNFYRVLSSANTYVVCTVNVVPEGGEWAEKQDPATSPIAMAVTCLGETKTFTNHNDGWVYGLKQSCDNTNQVTITFYEDWVAKDGSFYCTDADGNEFGTEDGTLYLGENYYNLVIDLNGHTIDRNATYGSRYGQVFYIYDYDLNVTIKDSKGGGKITGGNAHYDGSYGYGGGIYVGRGALTLDGVEISDNMANYGGGIYWDSDYNFCVIDSTITDNYSYYQGGGIYGTDWGDMYFGGKTVVEGNSCFSSATSNLYLSDDDVYINHAKGQATGVPNRPLTEGAKISISIANEDYENTLLISGSGSCFDMESLLYFTSDNSAFFVRGVYDKNGGSHTNKLHYTPWGYIGYPVIDKVSIKNSELIEDISFERADQIISITAKNNTKSSFENISLDNLINYTLAEHAVQVVDMTSTRNMVGTNFYRVLSSANTYVVCTVNVEVPFVCENHIDDDRNRRCDICGEFVILHFEIKGYSNSSSYKTVVLYIPEAGTYSVVCAKYETDEKGQRKLRSVEIQEVTTEWAQTAVARFPDDFTFESGDKIMLWSDMESFVPKCAAYVVD